MTWPSTTPINTTNLDADTDTVSGAAGARSDLKTAIDRLNLILAEVTTGSSIWHTGNSSDLVRKSLANILTHVNGCTISNVNPRVDMRETGVALDQAIWMTYVDLESWHLRIFDDAFINAKSIIRIERSGTGAAMKSDSMNFVTDLMQYNGLELATETFVNSAIAASVSLDTVADGTTGFEDGITEWTLSDPSIVADTVDKYSGAKSMKIPSTRIATSPHIYMGLYSTDSIDVTAALKSSATTNVYTVVLKYYDAADVYIAGEDKTITNVTAGNAGTAWNRPTCVAKPPWQARYVSIIFTATTGELRVDALELKFNPFYVPNTVFGSTGRVAGNDFRLHQDKKTAVRSNTPAVYVPFLECPVSGTLRFVFSVTTTDDGTNPIPFTQVARNGVNVGTVRFAGGPHSEDIAGWVRGDSIEMYMSAIEPGDSVTVINWEVLIAGEVIKDPLLDVQGTERL